MWQLILKLRKLASRMCRTLAEDSASEKDAPARRAAE